MWRKLSVLAQNIGTWSASVRVGLRADVRLGKKSGSSGLVGYEADCAPRGPFFRRLGWVRGTMPERRYVF
jgi:hypothetical protein